jgi:anionic cell wall polymer biosynthesis LytR-Cps2A-Psr (LCP) family protein
MLRRDTLEIGLSEDRVINTLFIIENDNKPIGTYVLFYYAETKRATSMEIPGEVGLILKQINRVDRIDTVYQSGKINNYVDEIEKLLEIKMNFTLVFDFPNLARTVDLFNGVQIFVPTDIKIFDGQNSILFSSGFTRLDGDKTIEYLRYQNVEEELESPRIRNQRFFSSLLKCLGENKDYIKNPQVNHLFQNFVQTNMNSRTMVRFIETLSHIDMDRFAIAPVGGNIREVSGQKLLFPYYDGSLVKEIVRQTLSSLIHQNDAGAGDRTWTVEVLNGTNVSGLAGRTAELLRGFGYDVINVGNTDRTYEFTEVIDRSNFIDEAKKFAEVINCKRVVSDVIDMESADENLRMPLDYHEYKADFTLIIGRDFNGRYAQG